MYGFSHCYQYINIHRVSGSDSSQVSKRRRCKLIVFNDNHQQKVLLVSLASTSLDWDKNKENSKTEIITRQEKCSEEILKQK